MVTESNGNGNGAGDASDFAHYDESLDGDNRNLPAPAAPDGGTDLADVVRGNPGDFIEQTELEIKAEAWYTKGWRNPPALAAVMHIPQAEAYRHIQRIETRMAAGMAPVARQAQLDLALAREEAVMRELWAILYDPETGDPRRNLSPFEKASVLGNIAKSNATIIKLLGLNKNEDRSKYYIAMFNTLVTDLDQLARGITDPNLANQLVGLIRKLARESEGIIDSDAQIVVRE